LAQEVLSNRLEGENQAFVPYCSGQGYITVPLTPHEEDYVLENFFFYRNNKENPKTWVAWTPDIAGILIHVVSNSKKVHYGSVHLSLGYGGEMRKGMKINKQCSTAVIPSFGKEAWVSITAARQKSVAVNPEESLNQELLNQGLLNQEHTDIMRELEEKDPKHMALLIWIVRYVKWRRGSARVATYGRHLHKGLSPLLSGKNSRKLPSFPTIDEVEDVKNNLERSFADLFPTIDDVMVMRGLLKRIEEIKGTVFSDAAAEDSDAAEEDV
jgi:hypothetical protein